MPANRRGSTKSSGPAERGGQSRLSFGKRAKVSKPSLPADTKKINTSSLVKAITRTPTPVTRTPSPVSATSSTADRVVQEQARDGIARRPQTKEEEEASAISDARIKKYWKCVEDERKAPRVHQNDLGIHEKILRHFDLSSQYGPCIGIARMKRWRRANGLGLHPPIEVLAVLLKEEAKGNTEMERARLDDYTS